MTGKQKVRKSAKKRAVVSKSGTRLRVRSAGRSHNLRNQTQTAKRNKRKHSRLSAENEVSMRRMLCIE